MTTCKLYSPQQVTHLPNTAIRGHELVYTIITLAATLKSQIQYQGQTKQIPIINKQPKQSQSAYHLLATCVNLFEEVIDTIW